MGILNLRIIRGIRQDDPEAYEILQYIFSSWNNRDFSSYPTYFIFLINSAAYSCNSHLKVSPRPKGCLQWNVQLLRNRPKQMLEKQP